MIRRALSRGPALLGSVVIVASLLAVSDAGAATLDVTYSDGQLSVAADGVSLRDVLSEVARQTGVRIAGLESLTEPVTVSLGSVPLREAFRKLLQAFDHAVIEEGPGRGGPGVSSVLIFGPKAQGLTGSPRTAVTVQVGPVQPEPSRVLEESIDAGEFLRPARNATQYGMVAFPEEDKEETSDASEGGPAR